VGAFVDSLSDTELEVVREPPRSAKNPTLRWSGAGFVF
jgi:hypothetical protein